MQTRMTRSRDRSMEALGFGFGERRVEGSLGVRPGVHARGRRRWVNPALNPAPDGKTTEDAKVCTEGTEDPCLRSSNTPHIGRHAGWIARHWPSAISAG